MRYSILRRLLLIVWLLTVGFALRADEVIRPSSRHPDTLPWNLEALSQPPEFTWLNERTKVRSLHYTGEPYGGRPTRVFAYFASPGTLAGDRARDRNLPAVVLVHGGGGTAYHEWATLWAQRGYAAIAMDLAGQQPNPRNSSDRVRLPDGGPGQGDDEKFGSVDKRPQEQWPYHAVANVVLAHSLIRSFDGVDPERTAVTGISWGGYLTCIVAGIDNRFQAAVPVYGCGFLHRNSTWLGRFAKMTPKQRDRWVELWDPSRYLPAVSMPILFVNGTNDFAYPLDSYMKSFDVVPETKQLRVTVNMPHGHQPGWAPREIGLFVDHHLLGKPPLPVLGEWDIRPQGVTIKSRGDSRVVSASLHSTTDTNAINKRTWTSTPLRVRGRTIRFDTPSDEITAWFITAKDKRGALISSKVVIRDPR